MKYTNASIRERGDGRWQARFYYKDRDKWKELSRSFKATSRRAARKRANEIKEELERASPGGRLARAGAAARGGHDRRGLPAQVR